MLTTVSTKKRYLLNWNWFTPNIHNNLFMAYLLVWAVSFCRRFFCPLYPRILKAFLGGILGIRWSWKIDELCEKGGKNVSFLTARLSANMKYVCISRDLLKSKINRAFWYWYVSNCQNLILNSLFAWKWFLTHIMRAILAVANKSVKESNKISSLIEIDSKSSSLNF